jgi:integrase/recombinase XerD
LPRQQRPFVIRSEGMPKQVPAERFESAKNVTPEGTDLRSAVAAYLEERRQRTGSDRTPIEYGRHLARFLGSLDDPLKANPAHVHAFAYAPGASGREPSPSTVIVRLAAIGGFYDFLRRMGLVKANPAADVKRPQLKAPAVQGLSANELRKLLRAIPDTDAGERDRAIILTAVFTGLRRSELFALRRGDLTRNGAIFYTVRIKGGNVKRRELPAPAFEAIESALRRQGRPLDTLPEDAPLWNVSAQGFYLNLRRYARNAKLPEFGIHTLRHTAAKLRRDAGAKLEDVQRLLNHSNLATTSRYLARLEGDQDEGWRAVAAILK